MEKKKSLWVLVSWPILLWAIMTSGCTSQRGGPIVTDMPTTTTILEVLTQDAVVDNTPTPLSVTLATPTLPAGVHTTLPDGFVNMMDPLACPHACYLGFMPGQTKEEVLTILESMGVNNPEINDEEEEDAVEGTTSISWYWPWRDDLRPQPYIYRYRGAIAFLDDYSVWIAVAPRELIPVALIVEQFGEPDYVSTGGADDDWRFVLIYLYQDTVIFFTAFTVPPGRSSLLSANTFVQRITIETVETYFAWACWEYGEIKFQEWMGYGGLGVYYNEYDQLLAEVSIVDCDDYKQ